LNISFLSEKLPYSQICGIKVGRPKKNGVIAAFDIFFPPYNLGHQDTLSNDEMDIYIFGFNAELYGPTIERFKIDTIFLYVPLLIQLGYFLHQQFEYIFVDSRFG